MQRELRDLLERKVAMGPGHGSGYYFDMNDDDDLDYDLQAGELMAGGKRRKAKKMTAMQRKMAKVRAGKRRGGDYVNLNDYSYYQGGAGKNTRRKRVAKIRSAASLRGFKNPLEKAQLDEYKAIKGQEWLRTVGPEYAAKLQQKAAIINRALVKTGLRPVGIAYNTAQRAAQNQLAAWEPYAKAAKRQGIQYQGPVAAPGNVYGNNQALITAAINAINAPIALPAVDAEDYAPFAY